MSQKGMMLNGAKRVAEQQLYDSGTALALLPT
jgi:hypothetical protein